MAETDPAVGLTSAQVRDRTERGLSNVQPESPSRSTREIIRANVVTRFNILLSILLVVILVAVQAPRDALFGIVMVTNAAIGIIQELRAKATLDRLALLTAPRARVLRDGESREIDIAGVVVDEDRPWQDLRFSPVFANGHRLNLRLRFEQRLIDASDDARMVLRLMARYTIPVGQSSRLFFGIEPFYDLNTTDWGGDRGRSQDRAFIGMGWPLGKRMSIEAGYMQQLFKVDGGEDLLNHLGVVTLRF